jgi:hypothetical protein
MRDPIDPDPQPIPGQNTKWPQSPCRVRYQAQRAASRAASSSRPR